MLAEAERYQATKMSSFVSSSFEVKKCLQLKQSTAGRTDMTKLNVLIIMCLALVGLRILWILLDYPPNFLEH